MLIAEKFILVRGIRLKLSVCFNHSILFFAKLDEGVQIRVAVKFCAEKIYTVNGKFMLFCCCSFRENNFKNQ